MAVVYVLQVMAHHGYGLEGWRTVRKSSGEPYSFETREAAQAALQVGQLLMPSLAAVTDREWLEHLARAPMRPRRR